MSTGVPHQLEDAIRMLVLELGFPEVCEMEFERLNLSNVLCSVAYKVIVKYCDKEIALFIKCLQNEENNNCFLRESRIFFHNEVTFYGKLLKEFMKLGKCRKNPEVIFRGAPKCYKIYESPTLSYIMLQDLVHEGYYASPNKPIDVQQAHQVMEELGRLHALSYVMKDQQPFIFANIVDSISETLFTDDMKPTFGRLFVQAMHDALKLAKASLPERSIYVEKLSDFTLNIYEKMATLARSTDDDEYKVVTHGDIRDNNILFHDKVDANVRFLDYQTCRYSSPIHDLQFFLLVALDEKTRKDYRDELIQRYHTTVCKAIYRLGSDPLRLFPYSALREQLRKHTKFALGLALAGLPLYMDEGATRRNRAQRKFDEGQLPGHEEQPGIETVLRSAQEARDRKTMKCKNKMMELVIDVVNQGYL